MTSNETPVLAGWLRQQLDEDEKLARAAIDHGAYAAWANPATCIVEAASGDLDGLVQAPRYVAVHIAEHDPERTLRAVEHRRHIIDMYDSAERRATHPPNADARAAARSELFALSAVLHLLAAEYQHRPGYRQEWRP